jgi:hypothetical protein
LPAKTPSGAVPPIEPVPVVSPAAAVPPPPPAVDPYATPVYIPPPPVDYSAPTYPPGYGAGYYGAPQPPRGLSIASMVTGIVGVFFSFAYGLGFLPSLAGVITGHIARKRQPDAKGMWLTGLICGYIGLGISLLWIVGIIIFVVFVVANPAYFDTGDLGTNG